MHSLRWRAKRCPIALAVRWSIGQRRPAASPLKRIAADAQGPAPRALMVQVSMNRQLAGVLHQMTGLVCRAPQMDRRRRQQNQPVAVAAFRRTIKHKPAAHLHHRLFGSTHMTLWKRLWSMCLPTSNCVSIVTRRRRQWLFHSPQQLFDEVCLALKKTLLRRIASSEAAPARAAANSDHDELPLICGETRPQDAVVVFGGSIRPLQSPSDAGVHFARSCWLATVHLALWWLTLDHRCCHSG